jgi:hypothetical protein
MKSLRTIGRHRAIRLTSLVVFIAFVTFSSVRLKADTATCGGGSVTLPFTDVPAADVFFCSIASAFYSGLTNGTSPTTFAPSANVTREQMAAFVSRTLEQSIRRNNLRAVTRKWYLPPDATGITLTTVGTDPHDVEFDGTDLWVANNDSNTIQRFRPSDGQLLQTFTGATDVSRIVAARGRIFAIGAASPGRLYFIDPTAGPGPVSVELTNLPANPRGIAFDGARVWTANLSGSVSIITFNPTQATNIFTGFSGPTGILFDGSNIWVTDIGLDRLLKLDANGNIVHSMLVGSDPQHMIFDGINIWIPNHSANPSSVTIARVKDTQGNPLTTPFVLATLTGNGLNDPEAIAFDGERMLVTNSGNNSVSIFKASDMSPLGSISTGANTVPFGACSDGMSFWVTLPGIDKLARF